MTLHIRRLVPAAMTAVLFALPAAAGEMMTDADLLSTIPGSTLTGVSNEDMETTWVQTYETGDRRGSSSGLFGTRPYSSDWRVGRGLWCETWDSGSGCWRIERLDRDTLQPWHGEQKLPNVWRIVTHSASDRYADQ